MVVAAAGGGLRGVAARVLAVGRGGRLWRGRGVARTAGRAVRGGTGAAGGALRAVVGVEQGAQRLDVFVYGGEDRADLVDHVGELRGQLLAQLAPALAVRGREGRQQPHRAERAVALVGGVQQPVALGGVVGHAGERLADLGQRLVVEVSGAAALHEAAGLLHAGGRLVEEEPAAVAVAVGHAELEVFHAALEPVERVARQGVGTRRGHAAERARRDAHREPAGRQALDHRERGLSWLSRCAPRLAAAPVRGSGTVAAPPPANWASMAAISCARCTVLTSASSSGTGSAPSPLTRANSFPWSASSADGPDCAAAAPWRSWSSKAWAKAFARRCADTFAITGGTSSRHDGRLPRAPEGLHAMEASTRSSE
ncbi:hypothetical protein GCM10020000_43500 [Streptomyces olivoverticillatus]